MIANISRRPFLRVGKYCITSYNEEWLARALDLAAINIGGDVSPFREDLIAGVMHYLEQVCPERVLSVENLYQKIRSMLKNVGMEPLAENLPVITPHVTIDLFELAGENPFPLFFYHTLRQELSDLRNSGVDSCAFSGLKKCAMTMEQARRWSRNCERTAGEILSLIQDTWNPSVQLSA